MGGRIFLVIVAVVAGVVAVFVTFVCLEPLGLPTPALCILEFSAGGLIAGLIAPFAATWAGLGVGFSVLTLTVVVLRAMERAIESRSGAAYSCPFFTGTEWLLLVLYIASAAITANLGRILRQSAARRTKRSK